MVETFLSNLNLWKKIPLYLTLSVVISTFFSYFAGLVFGFNRLTLIGCFGIFFLLLVILISRRGTKIITGVSLNKTIIFTGLFVYLIYFIALYPAIFNLHDGYFVMGGPNWQDTAMHQSIIESLANGNFPPQAPYFSGQPLTYYYFADLHAAIINTFFGRFFPEVLTLINPFLAMTFFFSVFALAFEVSKKKALSIVAGIAAVFYSNLEFINLIKKLIIERSSYISVITGNPYNYDQKYFLMTPVSDYFLQNRPMMVGLPLLVLVILMTIEAFKDETKNYALIFAGILVASLIKFQLFGFIIGWLFFGIFLLLNLISKKIKFFEAAKKTLIFAIPTLVLSLLFIFIKVGSRSVIQVGLDTLTWFPWKEHDLKWFFLFIFGDLGIGFVIFLVGSVIRKIWKEINILSIYLTAIAIFAAPFILRFTIYEFDMLKFFYYLVPLVCVFLAYYFAKSKYQKTALFLFILITLVSSITSTNLLIHSFLNKTEGYSMADYESGIWIKNNTPQESVFVTMPTVHSAPTDIGGRLRIISYINWPYSHGFNVGEDNVFSRVKDVEEVYKTGDVSKVRVKYKAKYVFYGGDERSDFPEAENLFDSNRSLKKIYDLGDIILYEIL